MATAEVNSAGPQGDQREKMLPPSEEDAPPVSKGTSASLNFSALTPCQFGISAQSFTPAASSSSNHKSRLAQMKARRRSGIGVRGSPETNSLIRFMAQERMKTPPSTHRTPEHVRNSPFLPRVASTLRQKMASFQSLMGVEESEASDPMPRQDSYTGGHIKTRDYLSGFIFCAGENDSAGMSAVKKKKRVHFGGPLSPEFFDKNLPPSTPLQKGATPAQAPTPGGVQFRSLLKTPQRSEPRPTQAQTDLGCPITFGASPTLTMPSHFRMQFEGEDVEEKDGKVKMDQPEESEPVKRSTRSAAKLASGKMKVTTRQWNRDVDRSLYGSRDYASKDPALSPITERLSFTSQSPTHSSHEIANDNEATGELTVTQAFENPPEDSITSPDSSKESRRGKGMRLSGQRSRGRGMKKRKVSVADCDLLSEVPLDQTAGKTEEHCEDQTATRLEASRETPLSHEEEENLHGDQAASQHENSSRSSQEDGGLSDSHLAPWQADFNFEDIFKPVATRGQQSVRRSLRNQSHSNNSAGLAWLPWTSPDSGKEGRRKTRGRRLSAALPVPPSVSEETRDNTS
uniref:PP1-binding domain-containing protein n=1 Tax=Scophthalmus maximus TaxID=52904 RepID=A0A8D3C697_SCOMX